MEKTYQEISKTSRMSALQKGDCLMVAASVLPFLTPREIAMSASAINRQFADASRDMAARFKAQKGLAHKDDLSAMAARKAIGCFVDVVAVEAEFYDEKYKPTCRQIGNWFPNCKQLRIRGIGTDEERALLIGRLPLEELTIDATPEEMQVVVGRKRLRVLETGSRWDDDQKRALAEMPLEKLDCMFADNIIEVLKRLPLKVLRISYLESSGKALQTLGHMPHLKSLDLSYSSGNIDDGLAALVGTPLTELDLSGCSGLTDQAMTSLRTFPLRTLYLRRATRLTPLALQTLAQLPLNELNLTFCNRLIERGIGPLQNLPLTALSLAFTRAEDADLEVLKNMPLQTFSLESCKKITDAGIARLAACRTLKALDLGRTQVTGKGLESLNALALKTLNLNGCKLEDRDLALLRSTSLRELSLEDCVNLTDKGMEPVGKLRLISLKLGSQISDQGLNFLAQVAPLVVLSVQNFQNRVTEKGVQKLRAKAPNVRVELRSPSPLKWTMSH